MRVNVKGMTRDIEAVTLAVVESTDLRVHTKSLLSIRELHNKMGPVARMYRDGWYPSFGYGAAFAPLLAVWVEPA